MPEPSDPGTRAAAARVVLSWVQARPLLAARDAGRDACDTSADLGVSMCAARLEAEAVAYPGTLRAAWSAVERVAADDTGCWEIDGDDAERIQCMSDHSGRLATLYPTTGPPALLLSGTLMHRIKGIDPGQDTRRKLRPLRRLRGQRLLDTATGLGYTAIEAARQGAHVVTVEWDPAVVAVARRNPWSAPLFAANADAAASADRRAPPDPEPGPPEIPAGDAKPRRLQGDITDVIETFVDAAFDRILHDPPVFELAGDLYGAAFYRQLRRVLAPGGRLFHYIGNLDSPSGARVARGAALRLAEAGFSRVERVANAFGLSARA